MIAILLVAFLPALIGGAPECNLGSTEVTANIQYSCTRVTAADGTNTTSNYPIACASNTGVIVKPGATWSDGSFMWGCVAGASNTMIWQVNYCFTPSGTQINLGGFVFQDGGAYYCSEDGTAANGARIVERTFTKNLNCTDATTGKSVTLGSTYNDSTTFYKCNLVNNIPTIQATGCRTPTGGQLGVGAVSTTTGQNYECMKYANGTLYLTPFNGTCSDTAGSHAMYSTWNNGDYQYYCALSSTNVPTIQLKKCVGNLTYTVNGTSHTSTNFAVSTNSIAALPNGVYYWCNGTGSTYSLILLPPNKQNCTDGHFINANWNNGTGRMQCQWVNNVPTIRSIGCIDTTTNKTYTSGQVINMGSYGIICECPSPTTADLRNMTAAEFTKYLATGSSVSASGAAGAGIQWTDAAGNIECADGYQLVNKVCTPIPTTKAPVPTTPAAPGQTAAPAPPPALPTCVKGYELHNNTCVDINECTQSPSPCHSGSENCVNTQGAYQCYCSGGYARYKQTNTCEEIECPCNHLTEA